ncbi:hypothetical protein [Bradyrhizobium sp. STM 3809]|uniref:hypothetical protein n=1 Tax=Bradyrhizobium sp. STM 3809 TaxID=551936 RepID=UPI001F0AEBAB|nr:hypothetical protein [Bradyrhizobium sp. STM 3809]
MRGEVAPDRDPGRVDGQFQRREGRSLGRPLAGPDQLAQIRRETVAVHEQGIAASEIGLQHVAQGETLVIQRRNLRLQQTIGRKPLL